MNNDVPSSAQPEPGRLAHQSTPDTAGWTRWLPGLQTARQYELAWLPHDLTAGLVLTTMLVPVGIAYAVASGVPGIYGLYATIVPLLAYALFGPSRILVLGPDSSLAAADPGRRAAAVGRRSAARRCRRQSDGRRLGRGVHPGGRLAARIHHRAAVQADPLRLHERHRVRGDRQPVAQAVRSVDRQRRAAARPLAIVQAVLGGRPTGPRLPLAQAPRGDTAAQALPALPGHPDRGGGRDDCGRLVRPRHKRRREGARRAAAGPARRSRCPGSGWPISRRS